jgi:catechol 2,3-dioxygenase-like lactoylglutathione lyase family enzyme
MAVPAGSNVAARIPAQDLRQARSFYADKLGLEPIEERPGGCVTGAEMASSRSSNPPPLPARHIRWLASGATTPGTGARQALNVGYGRFQPPRPS